MQRRRIKHKTSFEERLTEQAKSLRDRAKKMPPGVERDALVRRARQAETASRINEWLSSPGLRSPE